MKAMAAVTVAGVVLVGVFVATLAVFSLFFPVGENWSPYYVTVHEIEREMPPGAPQVMGEPPRVTRTEVSRGTSLSPWVVASVAGPLAVMTMGLLVRLARRLGRRQAYQEQASEEFETVRVLLDSLERMDRRVESLETLLLERPAQPGMSRPESRRGAGQGVEGR